MLLSKWGCKVGDKLYKYVLEGKSGHARTLDVLVARLPYLPAHFSSSLIESLLPQLVNNINQVLSLSYPPPSLHKTPTK